MPTSQSLRVKFESPSKTTRAVFVISHMQDSVVSGQLGLKNQLQ